MNNNPSIKRFETVIPHKKRKLFFGNDQEKLLNYNSYFKDNTIRTTKYNLITWIPKSLLLQFLRAANVYFLIVCILTFFPFSTKTPATQCGTFALVLFITMIKEGVEDFNRYLADKKINEKKTQKFNYDRNAFEECMWKDLKVGNLIKVISHEEVPADIVLMKTSLTTGMCFLDTMNLDGETYLKNKMTFKEYVTAQDKDITNLMGKITCDEADENLNTWSASIEIITESKMLNGKIDNLILKGCTLKNTDYIIGIVIYSGHSTKIMKNAKKPAIKVSNLMKTMNILLYSLFAFLIALCLLFSGLFIWWQGDYGKKLLYLQKYDTIKQYANKDPPSPNGADWISKFLTFFVAYSYIIPISLYVGLEVLKLVQSMLIASDQRMYDSETNNNALARTSDLIEELGQVEFVFSDKTGTLTKNEMIFRKCSINNIIYGETNDNPNTLDKEDNAEKYLLNGDPAAFKVLQSESHSEYNNVTDFFTICSVCHAAYIEEKEGKSLIQSSSPDEVALIAGAGQVSFNFVKKTPGTIETFIGYKNDSQKWNLLLELPFDSTRKRMSVFVNLEGTNEYWMFTKGADSEMLKAMTLESSTFTVINQHLKKFAKESLRTLVMAKKKVTKEEIDQHIERVNGIEAMNAITIDEIKEKAKQQTKLFEEIERGFEYVGCSAIEDKLQDNVGKTIEDLMSANIRVWVLTGDKKETALEIGKSCRLVLSPKQMDEIDLANTSDEHFDSLEDVKLKLDHWFYKFYTDKENEEIEKKAMYTEKNLIKSAITKKMFVIIDGKNLTHVLSDDKLKRKFFRIGLLCNSVICSRVSPSQKAEVVKLAHENGHWITLSVGDGANDVPMILTASIGIGISGKEGTQAVRSADYAIGQFQFLKVLLMNHGRWGYRRVSFFIYFYFYKNILLVFTEYYYTFFSGFSGSLFYPQFLPLLYNAFWTSWPSMITFSIEKDVDAETSLKLPKLYGAGQKKIYFNLPSFWRWVIFSIIHGLILYFCGLLSLENSMGPDGKTYDHFFKTVIIFSLIIHIQTYKMFIELKHWNSANLVGNILSIIFYYSTTYILSVPLMSQKFDSNLLERIFLSSTYFKTYIMFALFPFIVLLPDIVYNYIKTIYFPSLVDIIIYNQKQYLEEVDKKAFETQPKSTKEIVNPFEEHAVIKTSDKANDNGGKKTRVSTSKVPIETPPPTTYQTVKYHRNAEGRKVSIESKTKQRQPSMEQEKLKSAQGKLSLSSLNENIDFNMDEGKLI